ncbi:MAG: NrfD/PsrC family molybdoenzyme membrane anchor subunit, partial [Acidobacteriota bacterium]
IFTRPQWRSWLVKGGFIIAGYSVVLFGHFLASLQGWEGAHSILVPAGLPLATMTAVYTAWLFAQSKARDLWQSPLLPPHLLVQTLLAGAAALVPVALLTDAASVGPLLWVLGLASLGHLLLVWGETTLPHVTAHAHLANHEMARGRYRSYFRAGIVLGLAGVAAPWIGALAAPLALLGLLAFEHAYVQAGQSVPLA